MQSLSEYDLSKRAVLHEPQKRDRCRTEYAESPELQTRLKGERRHRVLHDEEARHQSCEFP